MPLMKYFVFVGSALVLLLLAMNWLLPESTAEPVYSSIERPVIRISSIETLPERVVLDTSMPYMAPPPGVMRVAAQPLQSALTFDQITPGSLPIFSTLAQAKTITEKRDPAKTTAKRDPAKKVVPNRVAPQAHIAAVKNHPVREAERDTKPPIKTAERDTKPPIKAAEQDTKPPVKTTFLDDIAGRFGQMFKVN
jgi:hypothetical protein